MLSVSCKDEHGNVLAQGHHIAPTELWPYMATIYEGYYNVSRDDLFADHEGKMHLGGMCLGAVSIQNTEDVLITDDDSSHLREFTSIRTDLSVN